MAKDGAQLSEDSSIGESIELSEGGGRRGEEDEEFYEEIEAPKFVDFTVPDQYRPDDRYWFCLRVGCDQKHEEEIDHEAISRNFVLRVMAARSPNVRLHKALSRNASGKNIKCPLSAPPKPAKSRLPRLAIVSMSQKMEKVRILPKVNSTPKTKGKQVAAKYLTTPRNKKILPNSNSFRSVQNPKSTVVGVAKSGSVAKALVFHSPKKTIRLKTSVELRTPLTKLCQRMKKLEITSQRKNTLGCSGRPSSKLGHDDSQKSLLLNSSTRQKVSNKEKSRTKVSRNSNCQKDQDPKSLRSGKCKSKGNLRKNCSLKEIVQRDSTAERTMETRVDDIKEHLDASSVQGHHTSTDSATEAAACPGSQVDSTSTKVSESESNGSQKSSQMSTAGNGVPRCQAEDDVIVIEGTAPKIMKDSSENQENLNDQATPKFEPSNGTASETQISDDKENTSDENRNINQSNVSSGKDTLGMKNNVKKIAQPAEKLCKGYATTGAPCVKLLKPKPTNPKPFRLRTDERGILREANLERKNHAIAPQKEVAVTAKLHSGDIQGHHDDIQKGSSRTRAVKTPLSQARNKKPTTSKVSRPQTSILERNTCQDLRNLKSPSEHVLQPHRMMQMTSRITRGEELSLAAETPSKDSKDLDAKTPSKNVTKGLVRSRTPAGSKSSSRGRRTVTIPKEPNFHTSHMPKSCVKKIAKMALLSPL